MARRERQSDPDLTGALVLLGFGVLATLFMGGMFFVIVASQFGLLGIRGPEVEPGPKEFGVLAVALVMLSLALACARAGASQLVEALASRRRAAQYPDQPWKSNAQWDGGVLRPDAASEARWYWFGAIVLFVFLAPFAVALARDWRALILVPFFGLDALLVHVAVKRTRAARRFGAFRARLSQVPLVPGASFDVLVEIPGRLSGELEATLTCVRTRWSGSGKNRRSHADTILEERSRVPISSREDASFARLSLFVPGEVPETHGGSREVVTWSLALEAEGGVDESFEVPVFEPGSPAHVERFPLAA